MTIQERIDADIKEAMRAKEADKLSALRMVKSAMMNAAIEKHGAGGKLGDMDSLAVIRKQVKQRRESIEGFAKGGRPDLAAKETRESDFLNEYLTAPLTDGEIQQLTSD